MQDLLTIGGKTYRSRLLIGTGKYRDFAQTRAAVEASGAEIVTVAIRRTNIGQNRNEPSLLEALPPSRFTYLPNTAGCYTAADAVRTLRLARELLDGHDLVKLEVLGDPHTLYPNMPETLKATEVLVAEGFKPMVYCTDDPIAARQLEEAGAVAVMPLGAPIGSGLGIQNLVTIRLIVEGAKVPVLVDAGVGTASDAAVAMELGCDGVLMNTAIAEAKDPIRMARAMKLAVDIVPQFGGQFYQLVWDRAAMQASIGGDYLDFAMFGILFSAIVGAFIGRFGAGAAFAPGVLAHHHLVVGLDLAGGHLGSNDIRGHHLGDAGRLAARVVVLAGQDLPGGVVDQDPGGRRLGRRRRRHRQCVTQSSHVRCSGLRRRLGALRERKAERWGPRTLDLDILLFGDRLIDEPRLKVPHYHMHARAFVLYPLAEIAPADLQLADGRTLAELIEACPFSGLERLSAPL